MREDIPSRKRYALALPFARVAVIIANALVLAWPAIYNGFPLLYPDSMTYVSDGRVVACAVFLHAPSSYYGVRSLFYSLGILPFHWNVAVWPVIGMQSTLLAWVLWLVVRSFAPRHTVRRYLVLVLPLALLTSASWFSSFVMPDILGPVLYLIVFLLVYARDTLHRWERVCLYVVGWWAITAHATHLVLAVALCLILVLFAAVERCRFRVRLKATAQIAVMIFLAASAQLALHGYLYGRPSLNGEPRPYLMARIIADGPGKQYLEKNCANLQWTICKHLVELSSDSDAFLWDSSGIFEGSSEEDRARLAGEEMPLVLATLGAYPRELLVKSATNFRDQLFAFGAYGFDSSEWLVDQFDSALPACKATYLRSRQARGALPLDQVSEIQRWVVAISLVAILFLGSLLWRAHSTRLPGLFVVIASMVVLNALITGVLSVVDDRYQCRVIWLLPLLAEIMTLELLQYRGSTRRDANAEPERAEAVLTA